MFNKDETTTFFLTHQNTTLPFAVTLQSETPGPHVAIFGSIHGHEPAGAIALKNVYELITDNKIAHLKGQITLVLGNPEAFQNHVRFVDENLNRVFKEELFDTYEGKRAREIRQFLEEYDISGVLDLHSVSVGNWQMAAYMPLPQNRELALQISNLPFHLSINSDFLPGSLLEEANKQGAVSLAIECGHNGDIESIETAELHTLKFLEYFGLISPVDMLFYKHLPHPTTAQVYQTIAIIKPQPDFHFVDQDVNTGTFVKKGEVYAQFDGGEYTAPQDCFIVMPDKNPHPNDFDAGFLCTKHDYQL